MPGLEAHVHLVESLASAVELAPEHTQVELVVTAFTWMAEPGTRSFWPTLVRGIQKKLPARIAEGVGILLLIADVLEGKDRSALDGLPPEERAFALDVLTGFDTENDEEDETALAEDQGPG
jgi:hypothetical protein